MNSWMSRFAIILVLTVAGLACHKPSAKPAASAPEPEKRNEAPDAAKINVTKDWTDLVFTYLDATGAYHDVTKIADVPEASRRRCWSATSRSRPTSSTRPTTSTSRTCGHPMPTGVFPVAR